MLQDLRYALRLLMRSPGFAFTAIVTLALGIGVTSAIFSVVDGVLFRPIPFPNADRLVMVWETDRDTGTSHEPGAWPDFVDFQQRAARVDTFAGVIAGEATLTLDRGEPVRLAGLIVTREFLPLMGVTPVLGRTFTADDERLGEPAVVVISEALWERTFQRDPSVLGRTIRLDERPHSVVGVVAAGADFGVTQVLRQADYSRGFVDRDARSAVDVWVPLQADPKRLVRDTHPLLMIGRLAPGATIAAAQEELASIAADLERTYDSNKARGVYLESLNGVIFGATRTPLLVLLAAVGVVLLITCANVANLLLARNAARRREVAVRTAIGADLSKLGRQFVVENLVLSVVATVLGVALAFALQRVLITLAPPEVPRLALVGINARVLGLAVAISAIVGVRVWRDSAGTVPAKGPAVGTRCRRRARRDEWTGKPRHPGHTGGQRSRLGSSARGWCRVAHQELLAIATGRSRFRSFWSSQGRISVAVCSLFQCNRSLAEHRRRPSISRSAARTKPGDPGRGERGHRGEPSAQSRLHQLVRHRRAGTGIAGPA